MLMVSRSAAPGCEPGAAEHESRFALVSTGGGVAFAPARGAAGRPARVGYP